MSCSRPCGKARRWCRSGFGEVGVPFGHYFRVGRKDGNRSWPVGGGSMQELGMATPAISFAPSPDGKQMIGHTGQSSTQVVIMSDPPESYAIIPLGESDHKESGHWDDQAAKLFSKGQALRTYFMRPDELMKHVTSKKVLDPAQGVERISLREVGTVLQALTIFMSVTLVGVEPPHAKGAPPIVGSVVPDFRLNDIHRRPRSLGGLQGQEGVRRRFYRHRVSGRGQPLCPDADRIAPELMPARACSSWRSIPAARIVRQRLRRTPRSGTSRSRCSRTSTNKSRMPSAPDERPRRSCSMLRRVIRYRGRIDDQYGVGFRRDKPASRDLAQALDELLAGKPITTPRTEIVRLPDRARRGTA